MQKSPLSQPDHTTFGIIFKRYASTHLVKEVVNAYNRSAEFGLKDEISFSNLIDALCEYKHVIEAQEVCGISEFSNQTKMHNMIFQGSFKMGWWNKCREIWEEIELKGVVCNLHSYSIYMDIQCKAGKPWKAVRLYKEFKRNDFPLDVIVYNNVVYAIGLSEGTDAAMGMYQEMLDSGCSPNVRGMVEMAQKYETEVLEKGILAKPWKDLGTKLLSEDSDNEGS
ncbi:hypothetical protein MRB53_013748 [Persea americana]|uniref:Uncharacterized protein n=1 Tax=Persea americana TaxID=3435 RepID=A0ACC2K8X8_PERAE|nr:hypothetical protein MRB53_013748 [Persea americana]